MAAQGAIRARYLKPSGKIRMKYVLRLSVPVVVVLALISLGWQARAEYSWSYRGIITNMGTRSEGFSGSLTYGGKDVPAKLGQVVTPIGAFRYAKPKASPWAANGWLRAPNLPAPPAAKESVDPGQTHWCRDDTRPRTPEPWVYVPPHHYWVDPDYLQAFSRTILKSVPEVEGSPFDGLLSDGVAAAGHSSPGDSGAGVFVYRQWVEAEGTRSAGERGELLYEGTPLRGSGILKTPIGTFSFARSDRLWEPQGWFPIRDLTTEDSAVSIDPQALSKGSYPGPKRVGTPADWCYAPEMDVWFAPGRLR